MDARYSRKTTPAKIIKSLISGQKKVQPLTNDGDGFCICPNCFHLVFDESLTGICPCCHYQFCPSCSIIKRSS
jgi:hypothetical protein